MNGEEEVRSSHLPSPLKSNKKENRQKRLFHVCLLFLLYNNVYLALYKCKQITNILLYFILQFIPCCRHLPDFTSNSNEYSQME